MSKAVNLGPSLTFANIKLAKSHFDPYKTGGALNQDVPIEQFEQLKVLYEKYCANTQYGLPATVTAFFPTMEKRSAGYTRCLGVRFCRWFKEDVLSRQSASAVASAN
jgi:hypothetical protein